MIDIAQIGRQHLADALAGKMQSCIVSEWLDPDTGQPVSIYWKPLTGIEQKAIDECDTPVTRLAMIVKTRARDASGKLIFASTGLASLTHDYDFDVIRAIAYLITGNIGGDADDQIEAAVKE